MEAAAIAAGASLIGGLLQARAAAEAKRRELMLQGKLKGYETQQQALQGLAQNQGGAFQSLLESYRQALTPASVRLQ